MPIVALTHWTQQFSNVGEQAKLGITMMLVGISLVLFILVAISLLVSLMSRIISGPKKKTPPSAPIREEAQIKSQPAVNASLAEQAHDPAVIAVIAAAVQAMLSESSSSSKAGFTIRRIRRV